MLKLTPVTGTMGKLGSVRPTFIDSALNNSDLTTYNITVNIGTPSIDRYIALVVGGRQTSTVTLNSATIGGIAMTRCASVSGTINLAIFISNIPVLTGTSATASVVCSATNARLAVAAYTLTGLTRRPHLLAFAQTGTSAALRVNANGCILAGGYNLGDAITWTDATNNGSETLEGPNVFSFASYNAGQQETRTITATGATNFVAASFSWV